MHRMAELMEQAWSSMEELCAQLEPGDWAMATECPGWTVKDQLAHICAIEARLLGRPEAPGGPLRAAHVKNDVGALNERELEARRSRTPEQLLEEYREVTAERGAILGSWTDEEWREEGEGFLGRAPRERVVGIRVVDVFTHEQDIRVAVGKPGHLNGAVARYVYDTMAAAMGFVLGKKAQAQDGQTVLLEIGAPGDTFAYGMKGPRAERLDALPEDPTARLGMDGETFLRLTAGRRTPEDAEAAGRLRVAGDRDLADRVLAGLNITP